MSESTMKAQDKLLSYTLRPELVSRRTCYRINTEALTLKISDFLCHAQYSLSRTVGFLGIIFKKKNVLQVLWVISGF